MNNNVKHVLTILICVNIECLHISELYLNQKFNSRIGIILELEEITITSMNIKEILYYYTKFSLSICLYIYLSTYIYYLVL